jgi:hypothetical protein
VFTVCYTLMYEPAMADTELPSSIESNAMRVPLVNITFACILPRGNLLFATCPNFSSLVFCSLQSTWCPGSAKRFHPFEGSYAPFDLLQERVHHSFALWFRLRGLRGRRPESRRRALPRSSGNLPRWLVCSRGRIGCECVKR